MIWVLKKKCRRFNFKK